MSDFIKNHKIKFQTFRIRNAESDDSFFEARLPVRYFGCSFDDNSRFTEWPKYNSEKTRIRANNTNYSKCSIAEAFAKEYGCDIRLSEEVEKTSNYIPPTLTKGSIIGVRVVDINKNDTILEGLNLKSDIVSGVNLYKYNNFKKFIPKDVIPAKVKRIQDSKVIVDPIAPLFEDWLNPIIQDPYVQKNIYNPKTIKVKNLRLSCDRSGNPKGFIGDAVIPNISSFVGEDYTVETFIPGSQIVLNIERNFKQWEGKTVEAFVTSYSFMNPFTPLICSVKEYLKFQGDRNIIDLFNKWCDGGEEWKKISKTLMKGIVTGVINTSKKCGVFIEVPNLHITGMVPMNPYDLCDYKPGDETSVYISSIEENISYDSATGQAIHNDPYLIEDDILRKCSLKPVLTFEEP